MGLDSRPPVDECALSVSMIYVDVGHRTSCIRRQCSVAGEDLWSYRAICSCRDSHFVMEKAGGCGGAWHGAKVDVIDDEMQRIWD